MTRDPSHPKWLSSERLAEYKPPKAPFAKELDIEECRTPFQRDVDAIVHSASFRRLAHKTQVMLNSPIDFPRTRLTHSLEVMGIGRQLARICAQIGKMPEEVARDFEDATAASSLCHDIGHPPFGHAAEKALDAIVRGCMNKTFSERGFDANKQNLRLIAGNREHIKQESLSLTAAVLDGIMKYKAHDNKGAFYTPGEDMQKVIAMTGTSRKKNPICYLVEIADDISYLSGDVEDALKCEWFSDERVHDILRDNITGFDTNWDKVCGAQWEALARTCKMTTNYEPVKVATIRGLLDHAAHELAAALRPATYDAWPERMDTYFGYKGRYDQAAQSDKFLGNPLYTVAANPEKIWRPWLMKPLIYQKGILQNAAIQESEHQARVAIAQLWEHLSAVAMDPALPSSKFVAQCVSSRFIDHFYSGRVEQDLKPRGKRGDTGEEARLVAVVDYIAGMTDRFALRTLDKINLRAGALRHTM